MRIIRIEGIIITRICVISGLMDCRSLMTLDVIVVIVMVVSRVLIVIRMKVIATLLQVITFHSILHHLGGVLN